MKKKIFIFLLIFGLFTMCFFNIKSSDTTFGAGELVDPFPDVYVFTIEDLTGYTFTFDIGSASYLSHPDYSPSSSYAYSINWYSDFDSGSVIYFDSADFNCLFYGR